MFDIGDQFVNKQSKYDIRNFGALNDQSTVNTKSIQRAIDACSKTGGTVLVADGTYVTGTIYLKSNVHLRIEAGAVLKGSSCLSDYATDTFKHLYKNEKNLDRCLIFAEDAQNISFSGQGVIDGHADIFPLRMIPKKTGRCCFAF